MKFKYRRYYLYYLGRVAFFVIGFFPYSVGMYIASKLGAISYYILGRYRRTTLENLTFAFGNEKTAGEIHAIARKVFENLGRNAFELIQFYRITKRNIDSIVRIRNLEILDGELAKGKGVIVVTAHFGNWELMPATIIIKGYIGSVVGPRIYFHKYDKLLNRLRRLHNVNIIYRDESPRKILKVLKANGIIGIVADQDVDSVEGIFVDFFGREAYTPMGPVALAKVSGSSLIPAFMLRKGSRHELVIEKPIELIDTGNKEEDVVENTRRWSAVIERYVRAYPDQWVWMHRRWKTKKAKIEK